MIKKFFCLFVLMIVALIGVSCTTSNRDHKPTKDDEYVGESISYVSLGDSIPEGYALPDYSSKDANGFVKDSYTYSLREYLEGKYKTVSAHNYATAGQTSNQLKDKLLLLKNEGLSETEQEMKANIIGADIISICIGANDILGPAQNNFINIVLNEDVSPYLTEFDNGISAFNTNFPIIVEQLKDLNPTAKLIFSNIYNPYAEFKTATNGVDIYYSSIKLYNIPDTKVKLIGQIGEAYIDGDTIYNESNAVIKTVSTGLNQIIETTIQDVDCCYMLDFKSCFDNYLEINNSYDVINAIVMEQTRIDVALTNPFNTEQTLLEIQSQVLPYIDPHPSTLGHAKIKNILTQKISNVFNIK